MWKTALYTLDHQEFRRLVTSGERGVGARVLARPSATLGDRPLSPAERETIEGILGDMESRGSVDATDDRRTNDLVNLAIFLVAEEAGIDAPAGAVATSALEEAHDALAKGGWLRKPLLAPVAAVLFGTFSEGRVYGGEDAWDADLRTAVLDPGEVRTLHSHLRDMAEARGSKLPGDVQDLLDQCVFPTIEAAARAQLGVLAVTRRV